MVNQRWTEVERLDTETQNYREMLAAFNAAERQYGRIEADTDPRFIILRALVTEDKRGRVAA